MKPEQKGRKDRQADIQYYGGLSGKLEASRERPQFDNEKSQEIHHMQYFETRAYPAFAKENIHHEMLAKARGRPRLNRYAGK